MASILSPGNSWTAWGMGPSVAVWRGAFRMPSGGRGPSGAKAATFFGGRRPRAAVALAGDRPVKMHATSAVAIRSVRASHTEKHRSASLETRRLPYKIPDQPGFVHPFSPLSRKLGIFPWRPGTSPLGAPNGVARPGPPNHPCLPILLRRSAACLTAAAQPPYDPTLKYRSRFGPPAGVQNLHTACPTVAPAPPEARSSQAGRPACGGERVGGVRGGCGG